MAEWQTHAAASRRRRYRITFVLLLIYMTRYAESTGITCPISPHAAGNLFLNTIAMIRTPR